jgi:HK97 family phage prohead protease
VLKFEVEVASADAESRTISGIAVPYGATADLGGTTYQFLPGSLEQMRDKTPLLLDHRTEKPVGVLTALDDSEDGAVASFSVDQTPDGDAALATAASGSRGGLSIGVNVVEASDVDGVQMVAAASLAEISLVSIPAFRDATVSRVTASHEAPADEAETDDPAEEVEVSEQNDATPEVAEEVAIVAAATKPALSLGLGEFVATSVRAMRGEQDAVQVMAALEVEQTPDVAGVIPPVYEREVLQRVRNERVLYGVFQKDGLPTGGKEVIWPREDMQNDGATFTGFRNWDAGAASSKFTIGTKTVAIEPWSMALAVHQDVQERAVIDFISYAFARIADRYATEVEGRIASLVGAAAETTTSFEEAVAAVYTNGRGLGMQPDLVLASPEFHSWMLAQTGQLMYSDGTASAKPYAGNIAGLPVVVVPGLTENYVVSRQAITVAESPAFRLTAANVSALQTEIALTKYVATMVNGNPQVTDAGGKNPGDVGYVPTYDDTISAGAASFPTPQAGVMASSRTATSKK